jgi:CheY-like chemotaxis protein
MRARPEWQHIPVVIVTAKDLTGEYRKRLNGMVEEVLEKTPTHVKTCWNLRVGL